MVGVLDVCVEEFFSFDGVGMGLVDDIAGSA